LPAFSCPGLTRLTSRFTSIATTDAPATAAITTRANFPRCGRGSSWNTSAAATAVHTACPYCASHRVSRLTSPFMFSDSVVFSPRRSSTSSTAHTAIIPPSSIQSIGTRRVRPHPTH
jgi:hypothetical protein